MPKPVKIVFAPMVLAASRRHLSFRFDRTLRPAIRRTRRPSALPRTPCPPGISACRAAARSSARRSGIIIRMPSRPPSTATSITRVTSRSKPRIMIAGIVTPTPKAIDSPAEPAVCTMLFSRIVAFAHADLREQRNSVIEMTATGIDALTVSRLSARDRATKRRRPCRAACRRSDGARRQLAHRRVRRNVRTKFASKGLSGLAPTISGNSLSLATSGFIRINAFRRHQA